MTNSTVNRTAYGISHRQCAHAIAVMCALLTLGLRAEPRSHPDVEPASMAEFWVAPTDLEQRDLFAGPWGLERAPNPSETYSFLAPKRTGTNPGMTVEDSRGREWSVKQGNESQTEVVVSRLLSALGYRQPPVYYLPGFTLRTGKDIDAEPAGRFRLKLPHVTKVGIWKWKDNPFVGTPPYQRLLVLQAIVSNGDLKDDNNALYDVADGSSVKQWYVVKDLGLSLGKLARFFSSRNSPRQFSEQPFILGVENGFVRFDYPSKHRSLMERLTPADVRDTCAILARLSDRQWNDAFRAGGYTPEEAAIFIGRLRQKINDGLHIG